uniref:Uncharacterized protein n=1 Tax=viral metagenome TaxID=1070528 RepID=A0A6H2A3U6_9ZZZZ
MKQVRQTSTKYYKLHKKNNPGLDEDIFDNASVVFIEHNHGCCPVLNFVSRVNKGEDKMDVEWFEIPYLPFGVEKVTKRQYEMAIGIA